MTAKLEGNALKSALATVPGWTLDESGAAISRQEKFGDFSEAFAFMTKVAILAEKLDHHPDWSNSYNKVSITLSTHSAGGLTEKDIALAREIDDLLG
ncbi:MAG TPA: 4a-hydroxytetrahydrobiopterin dehydratase [Devosiaceae bacterium]